MHQFPINFQDWTLSLSLSSTLGQQYDQNSHSISISGDIPQGWDWYLLVRVTDQNKTKYNAYLLTQEAQCLSLVLDATILVDSGNYELQLKGIQRSDPSVIRHTNTVTVTVHPTLDGDTVWPSIPTEFTQIEGRIQSQAAQVAQQAGNVARLTSQVENLTTQAQKAALSTSENVATVQKASEEIEQQAAACHSAISEAKSHATQARDASERAENANATAQAAATSALKSQNAAEAASTQAQASLSDTLVARDQATECVQDFQSTISNIYTKQECDNQFARALVVDTGISMFHEIYPEPGSNIVVTAHGYTQQDRTSSPSPDNICPIHTQTSQVSISINGESITLLLNEPLCAGDYIRSDGVEYHDQKWYQFTGNENELSSYETLLITPGWPGQYYQFGYTKIICDRATTVNNLIEAAAEEYAISMSAGWIRFSQAWYDRFGDKAGIRQYLKEQHHAGTPLTVVFQQSTTGNGAVTYQNTPTSLIAKPDTSGKITLSSDRELSATYNKSLVQAFSELQAAFHASI